MRREGYSCISDFKNEINQWKSFGDGTRGRSHVRAVPSSSCGQCAYLPCQFSRCCHLGYWLHYSKSSLLVSVLADRLFVCFWACSAMCFGLNPQALKVSMDFFIGLHLMGFWVLIQCGFQIGFLMCLEFSLKCGLVESCLGCDFEWTLFEMWVGWV